MAAAETCQTGWRWAFVFSRGGIWLSFWSFIEPQGSNWVHFVFDFGFVQGSPSSFGRCNQSGFFDFGEHSVTSGPFGTGQRGKFSEIRRAGIPLGLRIAWRRRNSANRLALGVCFQFGGGGARRVTAGHGAAASRVPFPVVTPADVTP